MRTDYKISSILRTPHDTYVKVRIYEGDFEELADGDNKKRRQYVRKSLLKEQVLRVSPLLSDDEIRKLLNKELAKDTSRVSIEEQAIV